MTLNTINPAFSRTFAPPIMESRNWLDGVTFPPDRPLINLAQAAPLDPPPEGLRRAIADACLTQTAAHLYGPVLGLPELRAEVAAQWSVAYGGAVSEDQVVITQGCNQAFCAIMATLAGPGDEVILPTPWYFNHKMWLDMASVTAVPLPTEADLIPDPERAAGLITPATKAIVLISPNNPGGAEYPAETLRGFLDLCRSRGIALIVDETYRDFDSRDGRPHELFTDPDWADTLIHLYSFSKAYRLTGHRVGLAIASKARLKEVEKFLDTVAICPNQLGQIGALWGLRNLSQWVAGERAEILARRSAMLDGFSKLEGWKMLGCGAYFAYVEHPDITDSPAYAERLVREGGVLLLPGTMFTPENDPSGRKQFRIAFANVDVQGIATLMERLPLARP
ncbi:aminotransferase [Paenirhodobacter populi]|uniref:aminotransferase n=1 Tax=Paenirhodobacter populi TaxID=2306993 RepID=UPI000FE348C1|nr:aminotransferase [Sinirhodobacter populi]RWR06429.1 aminotransferase [Sinirhodobacter populi]